MVRAASLFTQHHEDHVPLNIRNRAKEMDLVPAVPTLLAAYRMMKPSLWMWSRFRKESAHQSATQSGHDECIGEQEYFFFSWCRHCVQGKDKTHCHREIDEADFGELSVNPVDCAVAMPQDDTDLLKCGTVPREPSMCGRRDHMTSTSWTGIFSSMDEWGLADLIFTTDQASNFTQLAAVVAQKRTIVRATPKSTQGHWAHVKQPRYQVAAHMRSLSHELEERFLVSARWSFTIIDASACSPRWVDTDMVPSSSHWHDSVPQSHGKTLHSRRCKIAEVVVVCGSIQTRNWTS